MTAIDPTARRTEAAAEPRGPGREGTVVWPVLLALIGLLSTGLPFLYLYAIFGATEGLPRPYLIHASLNALCNIVVMLVAWGVGKRARAQLAWILFTTAIVHGLLLFVIVYGRLYYSRPMMMIAVLVSIVAAAGLVWLRDRIRRPRVGVIAFDPAQEVLKWIPGRYELLNGGESLRGFDLLLVDFDDDRHRDWMRAVSSAMLGGQDVRHLAEYVEGRRGRVSIDHFHIDHVNRPSQTLYRSFKRALDLVVVLLTLPVVVPVTALAALAIWATMGRPIFFHQERVGHAGKVFTIWKLRTMTRHSDKKAVATVRKDSRVTPLGSFLRRFRIDELPQMWNVLKGEMSLIGPRPEQPNLAATYSEQMPAFACRHLMRPGITGWAQVRAGYAADLGETREKLSYDLYYLKNASVTLDLEIMARTAFTLITGRGVR